MHLQTGLSQPLLTDFGAASLLGNSHTKMTNIFTLEQREKLEKLEVRAFSCLLDDLLLNLVTNQDSEVCGERLGNGTGLVHEKKPEKSPEKSPEKRGVKTNNNRGGLIRGHMRHGRNKAICK